MTDKQPLSERIQRHIEYLKTHDDRRVTAIQLLHEALPIVEAAEGVCEWAYDEEHDKWDGSCGAAWCLNDGGPKENEVKYCPICGKPVRVKEEP